MPRKIQTQLKSTAEYICVNLKNNHMGEAIEEDSKHIKLADEMANAILKDFNLKQQVEMLKHIRKELVSFRDTEMIKSENRLSELRDSLHEI